MADTDAD